MLFKDLNKSNRDYIDRTVRLPPNFLPQGLEIDANAVKIRLEFKNVF